ncbi:hypothetical protein IQ06DRAFT_310473 [Phaeosphaeriaceae sp. SRC1lsM3a]|nr:hypothetical protein IQ06DRAFT_310473 [Stagonospora sp. SRC1lsM3a]
MAIIESDHNAQVAWRVVGVIVHISPLRLRVKRMEGKYHTTRLGLIVASATSVSRTEYVTLLVLISDLTSHTIFEVCNAHKFSMYGYHRPRSRSRETRPPPLYDAYAPYPPPSFVSLRTCAPKIDMFGMDTIACVAALAIMAHKKYVQGLKCSRFISEGLTRLLFEVRSSVSTSSPELDMVSGRWSDFVLPATTDVQNKFYTILGFRYYHHSSDKCLATVRIPQCP